MKTITLTLYRFDELNQAAKEKALTVYRHLHVEVDWWESEYEDFVALCAYLGITVEKASIRFSGFYSQSDGSGFSAAVSLTELYKAITGQAWKPYAPLQDFPFRLPNADRRVVALMTKGSLSGDPKIIGRLSGYGVFTDLGIQVDYGGRAHENIRAGLLRLEAWLQQIAETLNHYLYATLEKQYEFLISDAAVEESISIDEYLFTADGRSANHLLALTQHKPQI